MQVCIRIFLAQIITGDICPQGLYRLCGPQQELTFPEGLQISFFLPYRSSLEIWSSNKFTISWLAVFNKLLWVSAQMLFLAQEIDITEEFKEAFLSVNKQEETSKDFLGRKLR